MVAPFEVYTMFGEKKKDNIVCVDTCIATEIGYLWHQGVMTLNSCCGHKKLKPSVVVTIESIKKMHELGYEEADIKCARPKQTFEIGKKI